MPDHDAAEMRDLCECLDKSKIRGPSPGSATLSSSEAFRNANRCNSTAGAPQSSIPSHIQQPISAPPSKHHRSATAPPWKQGQQWGPDFPVSTETPEAREELLPATGHARSRTLPIMPIIVVTPAEASPDERAAAIADLRRVSANPDRLRPESALRSRPRPEAAVQTSRASRLSGLRNVVESAERRKSRRDAGAE